VHSFGNMIVFLNKWRINETVMVLQTFSTLESI